MTLELIKKYNALKRGQKTFLIFASTAMVILLFVLASVSFVFAWLISASTSTREKITGISEEIWSQYVYQNGDIVWQEKLGKPIKVIKDTKEWGYPYIQVYKIGEYVAGPFKGKNLAMGRIVDYSWDPSTDIGEGINPDMAISLGSYAFFISDGRGKSIAWSPRLIHYTHPGLPAKTFFDLLGFTSVLSRRDDFTPKEFSVYFNHECGTKYCLLGDVYSNSVPMPALFSSLGKIIRLFVVGDENSSPAEVIIGHTTNLNIVRVGKYGFDDPAKDGGPRDQTADLFSEYAYFLKMPFGLYMEIYPEADILVGNESKGVLARVEWKAGVASSITPYTAGFPTKDCFGWFTSRQALNSALVEVGQTYSKELVYEIDKLKYPLFYQCLYEKTGTVAFDNDKKELVYRKAAFSFEEFLTSHPFFIFRHTSGKLMTFYRTDYFLKLNSAKD